MRRPSTGASYPSSCARRSSAAGPFRAGLLLPLNWQVPLAPAKRLRSCHSSPEASKRISMSGNPAWVRERNSSTPRPVAVDRRNSPLCRASTRVLLPVSLGPPISVSRVPKLSSRSPCWRTCRSRQLLRRMAAPAGSGAVPPGRVATRRWCLDRAWRPSAPAAVRWPPERSADHRRGR